MPCFAPLPAGILQGPSYFHARHTAASSHLNISILATHRHTKHNFMQHRNSFCFCFCKNHPKTHGTGGCPLVLFFSLYISKTLASTVAKLKRWDPLPPVLHVGLFFASQSLARMQAYLHLSSFYREHPNLAVVCRWGLVFLLADAVLLTRGYMNALRASSQPYIFSASFPSFSLLQAASGLGVWSRSIRYFFA